MPVTSKKRHERSGMRYADLKAWQACRSLVLAVYQETSGWPSNERYGMISQIRRAAVSAALNIAEGSAKSSRAEFRRFLDIAQGSLTEVACLMEFARDLKFLGLSSYGELEVLRDHAGKLTWGLYRSLK